MDFKKEFERIGGGKLNTKPLNEGNTGWRLFRAANIDSKLWMSMKYDLRDQFDELVKIGPDFGVFQNAPHTNKLLKQIKRLMDKIS